MMLRQRLVVIFVLALALAGCADAASIGRRHVAGAPTTMGHGSRISQAGLGSPVAPAASATQFIIDSSIGEVFESAATSARPRLSSEAAWWRYARLNGSTRRVPPHFVAVRLGYLTLPVGPGFPDTAHHELAWAYSWHECMPSINPNVTSPPLRPCVTWLFLDAVDGRQIDQTQQH